MAAAALGRVGGVRAGLRDLPPAACADGRARDRPTHGHGRLGGCGLLRRDGAEVPDLSGCVGVPDVPDPRVGGAAFGAAGVLRVRGAALRGRGVWSGLC